MKYRIYTFIAVVFLLLFGGLFWIIYENWNHGKRLEVATVIPTTTSEKGSNFWLSIQYRLYCIVKLTVMSDTDQTLITLAEYGHY